MKINQVCLIQDDPRLEALGILNPPDEERETLIRDNTRKLYMAATRAGQRLALTYAGDLPAVIKAALESKDHA